MRIGNIVSAHAQWQYRFSACAVAISFYPDATKSFYSKVGLQQIIFI